MHQQLPRFKEGTIAVAVSGGKDSAAALELTHRHFSRRPTVRIVALSVDEGIRGYRPPALRCAQELGAHLGIEHLIIRASDALDMTTDRAARRMPETVPCSYCGVWRRRLLNTAARNLEADALVLGFNLDDLAQTVLMNLVRADLDRLRRMAPHRQRQAGLVPRIAPLAGIPEREVFLYARLTGLPFDHGECPHSARAARNIFREIVWQLEETLPGSRHALLRTQKQLADLLEQRAGPVGPGRCRACGEPAAAEFCRACEYLHLARGRVMQPADS